MKFISDLLWREIELLIPVKSTNLGRPESDNRKALEGIIFILKTGSQWNQLPEKYGAKSTVHNKYMVWCRKKVFEKIMTKAREYYRKRNSTNKWFALDAISKKAPLANFSGKNPTDRGKRGIKHCVLVDRKGAPLYITVGAANTHDSKFFESTVSQMRKSKNVRIIAADSAFDVKRLYSNCKEKNIALIASPNARRKKNVHKFNVPYRWIVEQTHGILSWFRGLKICWSKTLESHLGFLQIACSLRLFKMGGILG